MLSNRLILIRFVIFLQNYGFLMLRIWVGWGAFSGQAGSENGSQWGCELPIKRFKLIRACKPTLRIMIPAPRCGAASSPAVSRITKNDLCSILYCNLFTLQPPGDPTRVDGVGGEGLLIPVPEDASNFRHLQIIQHRIDIPGLWA